MEATPGIEPGIRALQAPALPLGHVASKNYLIANRSRTYRASQILSTSPAAFPRAKFCYIKPSKRGGFKVCSSI
jgi:hypothetical protein